MPDDPCFDLDELELQAGQRPLGPGLRQSGIGEKNGEVVRDAFQKTPSSGDAMGRGLESRSRERRIQRCKLCCLPQRQVTGADALRLFILNRAFSALAPPGSQVTNPLPPV